MTPRPALASALLAAALVLGACGGGGDNGGEAAAEEDGGPPTPAEAYSEIVARIAEEGSNPELALEAFAGVFGPIPGAPEPTETRDGPGLGSGTGAIRLVLRHFDEFTDEQRQGIEEKLIPEGLRPADSDRSGAAAEAGAGSTQLASAGGARLAQAEGDEEEDARAELDEGLTQRGQQFADKMAREMGISHSRNIYVGRAADPTTRGWLEEDAGVAVDVNVAPGTEGPLEGLRFRRQQSYGALDRCLILIRGTQTGNAEESTLAHEVFHCLHMELAGLRDFFDSAAWVTEGAAEWAGEAWVGQFTRAEFMTKYLRERQDLLARDYDAMGFWAQLDGALDGALWTALPAILREPADGNSVAAFRAALAADPDFDTLWAPQHARRRDLLPELWWELDLHELREAPPPELRPPVEEVDVASELAEDGEWSDTVPARTPSLYELSFPDPDEGETETVTLEVTGHGGGAWVGGGRASTTSLAFAGDTKVEYCLDPAARCDRPAQLLPSETLMIGVVGLEGEAEIVVSPGEEPCPQTGVQSYRTPEDAIRACLVALHGACGTRNIPEVTKFNVCQARQQFGEGYLYWGECLSANGPTLFCSREAASDGDRRTYTTSSVHTCAGYHHLLEEGDSGWVVTDIREHSVDEHGNCGIGTGIPPDWPQP